MDRPTPHPGAARARPLPRGAGRAALGLKAQVHAVLAKEGVAVPMRDLFGKHGMGLLAETRLGTCYRMRVDSLLELIDAFDGETAFLSDAIAARLRHHDHDHGYDAIQAIPGVGPTFADGLHRRGRRHHPLSAAGAAVLMGRVDAAASRVG